ncbi:MAG: HdeD family acid-resistance protein, partial [Thermoguttaceae bacterium]
LANIFWMGKWEGFMVHLVAGILYTVVGFLLLDAPLFNAVTLTFLLAAFLIVVGLIRMIGALVVQFHGWTWAVLNGGITFLLGMLIYKSWPSSGLWVIGLFVGIEIIFAGFYWIMFACALRRFNKRHPGGVAE